jgi:predicted ATPase
VVDRLGSDHLTTQRSYLLNVKNKVKDLVEAVVEDVAIEAASGLFKTLAELIITPLLGH